MASRPPETGGGPAVGYASGPFGAMLTATRTRVCQGVIDKRLEQVSHRRVPVDEVMALVERYRRRQADWNVKPFHAWYQRDGGQAQLHLGQEPAARGRCGTESTWAKQAPQAAHPRGLAGHEVAPGREHPRTGTGS